VISPCLSNIFLHHVLDEWFESEVRPRLKGRCTLNKYIWPNAPCFCVHANGMRRGMRGRRQGGFARLN
jgi:hypothetical protein